MDNITIAWWLWWVLGALLLALEISAGTGFYSVFFGLSAMAVGVLSALKIVSQSWLQLLFFALISIILIVLFRKRLQTFFNKESKHYVVDSLIGVKAQAVANIQPQTLGQVEMRGTVWKAFNVGESAILMGQTCVVTRLDNLTLQVTFSN